MTYIKTYNSTEFLFNTIHFYIVSYKKPYQLFYSLFNIIYHFLSKPTTFATIIRGSKTTYFFALPGNPVSAMVTFYLFVLPAIRKLAGFKNPYLQRIQTRVSKHHFNVHTTSSQRYGRCMDVLTTLCAYSVPEKI